MSSSSSSASPSSSSLPNSGVAGRTNYAAWDRLTTDLVTAVDVQEEQETLESSQKVGLDGKYARSQAEAQEREKLRQAKKTKKKLESFQKRDAEKVQTFAGLLGPVRDESTATSTAAAAAATTAAPTTAAPVVVRLTRDRVDAFKRVLAITDTMGHSMQDTIVLTADLNQLESHMALPNPAAKSFPQDAENNPTTVADTTEQQQQQRSIYGLIKVFMSNLHHCTVLIKCKIVSGTVELHNCSHVLVKIASTATVATIQADLSSHITIEFHDAPSGQNTAVTDKSDKNKLYWGESPDDRIFHAGVSELQVRTIRDGVLEYEIQSDYIRDGATAVGTCTAQEFQFVTSVVQGQLVTEKVVRAGATTGTNARAMTQRELQVEEERRKKAEKMAVGMANDMVQVKDKNGNVLVKKTEPVVAAVTTNKDNNNDDDNNDQIEEVITDSIKEIVKECEINKARGNQAFGAGEYAQAILLYSLALDTATQLGDQQQQEHLFPTDVVYSNRSACFLKLGQHEKASADATTALTLNPTNLKAMFRSGLALHAMGQYDQALPWLAKAHQMEPHNKQIKQALQFCEMRMEQDQRKRMAG